jgi:ribosomal protein L37AE/L43A
MSVATVTSSNNRQTRQPTVSLGRGRVRRGLAMTGWFALLLGSMLGALEIRPDILSNRFPGIPLLLLNLAGATLVGLLIGMFAGLWLRGKHRFLRSAIAVFSFIAAIIMSEIVIGLALHQSLVDSLKLIPDDIEGAQIGLGLLAALAGVRTGRQKHSDQRSEPQTSEVPTSGVRQSIGSLAGRVTGTLKRIHLPAIRSGQSQPRPVSNSRPSRALPGNRSTASVSVRALRRIELQPRSTVMIPKPKRRKVRRLRQKVHLGKSMTTVCPYCLEEVLPKDPRGIVVCDICGTPHHGDCWAISGKCEVPHLQA